MTLPMPLAVRMYSARFKVAARLTFFSKRATKDIPLGQLAFSLARMSGCISALAETYSATLSMPKEMGAEKPSSMWGLKPLEYSTSTLARRKM